MPTLRLQIERLWLQYSDSLDSLGEDASFFRSAICTCIHSGFDVEDSEGAAVGFVGASVELKMRSVSPSNRLDRSADPKSREAGYLRREAGGFGGEVWLHHQVLDAVEAAADSGNSRVRMDLYISGLEDRGYDDVWVLSKTKPVISDVVVTIEKLLRDF